MKYIKGKSFKGKTAALLPVLLLLAGCKINTIPQPKQQEQGQLANPPLLPIEQEDLRFSLAQQPGEIIYSPATFMLLSPALNTDDLKHLMNASIPFRTTQVDMELQKSNELEPGVAAAEAKIAVLSTEKEEYRQSQLGKVPLEDKEPRAAVWFEEIMTENIDDPAIRAQILETFGGYCEAKILELALHETFVTRSSYTTRPSPNQLCEDYYERNGFFTAAEGEVDHCSAADEGGTFFKCMWLQGVLKTMWYAPETGRFSADKLAIITDLVTNQEDTFRAILARNPEFVGSTQASSMGGKFIAFSTLTNYNPDPARSRCNTNKVIVSRGRERPNNTFIALDALCNLFDPDVELPPLAPLSPMDDTANNVASLPLIRSTPKDLIDAVESIISKPLIEKANGVEYVRTFILPEIPTDDEDPVAEVDPQAEGDEGEAAPVVDVDRLTYSRVLRYFSRRQTGVASESDMTFHRAQPPYTETLNSKEQSMLPKPDEDVAKFEDEIIEVMKNVYGALSFEAIDRISAYEKDIVVLQNDILALQNENAELSKIAGRAKIYASDLGWAPDRPFDSENVDDFYSRALFEIQGVIRGSATPDERLDSTQACIEEFESGRHRTAFHGSGPNLAVATAEISLKVTRTAEDLMIVDFWFGGAQDEKKFNTGPYNGQDNVHIKGCLDLTANTTVECQVPGDHTPVKLTYNAALGRINFAFPADLEATFEEKDNNNQVIGEVVKRLYPPLPRSHAWCAGEDNRYFNDLPADDLTGKVIELEMYPDLQDGVMSLLGGKVILREPDHPEDDDFYIYEGAISGVGRITK